MGVWWLVLAFICGLWLPDKPCCCSKLLALGRTARAVLAGSCLHHDVPWRGRGAVGVLSMHSFRFVSRLTLGERLSCVLNRVSLHAFGGMHTVSRAAGSRNGPKCSGNPHGQPTCKVAAKRSTSLLNDKRGKVQTLGAHTVSCCLLVSFIRLGMLVGISVWL